MSKNIEHTLPSSLHRAKVFLSPSMIFEYPISCLVVQLQVEGRKRMC